MKTTHQKCNAPGTNWPVGARPIVQTAGRFPLGDRHFEVGYSQRNTVALHLYDHEGRMRIGRQTYDLRPGDITFSPHGSTTYYDLPRPGHHLCIHFRPERWTPTTGRYVHLPVYLRLGARASLLGLRMQEVARLHQADGHGSHGVGRDELLAAAASASLQSLLIEIAYLSTRPADPAAQTASRRGQHGRVAVERLLTLIDTHLDKPMEIPELADRVGLTQNYLARLFHRQLGMTIQRYRMLRRVEMARLLLTTTDLTITQIAGRVGVPDLQHFNKQFRKVVGTSPTATRTLGTRSAP